MFSIQLLKLVKDMIFKMIFLIGNLMVLGFMVIILKKFMGFENFLSNKLLKGDFYCFYVLVSQVFGFGLMDVEVLVIRVKSWVFVLE